MVVLLASLCGCSHQKTLSRDDLRSEFTQAISYAAETELLAQFVRQGHATEHFAEAHPSYLGSEIDDSLKELAQKQAEPALDSSFHLLQEQLRTLSRELGAIRSAVSDQDALASAQAQAAKVRQTLQRAQAEL